MLVLGANGQLSLELKERLGDKAKFLGKDDLDITKYEKLNNFIKEYKPKVVINCSAFTKVDQAEEMKTQAFAVNSNALKNLAIICKEFQSYLVHISTDYVFNGNSYIPYKEDDETSPICVYGKSKLDGENNIKKYNDDFIILRTSWLYSSYGNNFVKTIIKLAKERENLNIIYDQIGTPTYAGDLADMIIHIINNKDKQKQKIYHYSNEGVASWYDFAKAIIQITNIKCNILPIETKDYKVLATRPLYSVFNKNKIKEDFQITIPYWKESLEKCLKKIF